MCIFVAISNQGCSGVLKDLVTCGHGQYLDYQTTTCKNICPLGYQLKDGACNFVEETCQDYINIEEFTMATPTEDSSKELHGTTFMILGKPNPPCYMCNKTVAITDDTEHYEIKGMDRVDFKSNQIAPNLVYQIDNRTYYVCLDGVIVTEPDARNTVVENIITYLLLSISIISLLLYFVAYVIFKRLRNVPGKIVAGNMLCLFLAYVFFVLRNIPGLNESGGCAAIGIFINYFFLASFTFNIIYASFIVRSLDSMDFESSVTEWTALKLWIIGLAAPFAVIAPAIALDHMPDNKYRPEYGGEHCFIDNEIGKVIYFIAPIGLCLFLAIILYLTIIIKLVQLARETRLVRSNHSEKIAVAIKLLIVLGFNWIFAVIAAIYQEPITTLIFIITCTLQGFFGFVVFICNKATVVEVKKCLNKKTNLNFEMSSSTRGANGKNITLSTDAQITKSVLQQKDSAAVLLKKSHDATA